MKGFNTLTTCQAQTMEMVQLWLDASFKHAPVVTSIKGKDDGSLEIRLSDKETTVK